MEPFAFQTPLGEAANFLIKGAPKLVRNGHNSFRLTLDLVRVP